MKTQKQAEDLGYVIDTCCNPPIAYRGPRFQPTEHFDVLTDLEAKLLKILADIVDDFDPAGCENSGVVSIGCLEAAANAVRDYCE